MRQGEFRGPDQGEPIGHYQCRLFAHVITAGPYQLTDLQLDQAAAGGVQASTARGLDPAMADRYSRARHAIADVQRARAILATISGPTMAAGTCPDQPNAGPMAELAPRPIVRPPSGGRATPDERARIAAEIPF